VETENDNALVAVRARQRSPNYPAISLPAAIDRVGRLYAADKKAGAPLDAAFRHMGFNGRNGKSSVVLSALKKYGLVEDVGGRIAPTQRAVEILVLSKDDPRRLQAIREAALAPDIYREVFDQFSEHGMPSDETLRAELIAYKSFNPTAVVDFVKDFKATIEFASLCEDSEILSELATPMTTNTSTELQLEASSATMPIRVPVALPTAQVRGFGKTYSFALSPEATAELRISGELRTDDLEMLRDYIDITIRALSRAARPKQDNEGDHAERKEAPME
jgi:hypothetical protein